jgi:hypothetical protein
MRSALLKFFQPLRVNDHSASFFAFHRKESDMNARSGVTVVAAISNDLDTRELTGVLYT